jgi:predicted  nucleic acid-binding Zn-ribbon protein
MTDDLWKEAKKFAKIKYKNVSQIDRDLDVFNNKMKKYETQLDQIENKKVKVNIDDAINFLSKEIGQNSQVMKTIEDSEQRVKELEQAAMLLEEQRNILGSDIIPKHVSLIKRVTGSITSFIRRKVSKIIGVIVFLFAI